MLRGVTILFFLRSTFLVHFGLDVTLYTTKWLVADVRFLGGDFLFWPKIRVETGEFRVYQDRCALSLRAFLRVIARSSCDCRWCGARFFVEFYLRKPVFTRFV